MNRERDYWPVLYAVLLALAFVGYPLVSGIGSALGFGSRGLSIFIRATILFASIAGLLTALVRKQLRVSLDPPVVLFLLLWVALLVRFVWDASMVPIPMDLPWFDDTLIILGAVLIPSLALVLVPSRASLLGARRLMLAMGTMAALLTIVAVVRVLLSENKLAALGRIGTDTMNPISLGQLGVILVITGLLSEPVGRQSTVTWLLDSWPTRWLAGLLGVALVIGSASKGPLLALVAVVLVAQASRAMRRPDLRRSLVSVFAIGIAGAGLVLAAIFLGDAVGLNIVGRILNAGSDASTLDRLAAFSQALRQFESAPWTGSAFVELQSRYYPHNAFIEVLMATGILGFCFLFAVVLFSVVSAVRLLRTPESWLVLVYIQAFVEAMLSGSLYLDPGFWSASLAIIGADRMLNRAAVAGSRFSASNGTGDLQEKLGGI